MRVGASTLRGLSRALLPLPCHVRRGLSRSGAVAGWEADFVWSPELKITHGYREKGSVYSSDNFVSLPVSEEVGSCQFHKMWLRLNCQCPACLEPSSGQRLVSPWLLPRGVDVRSWREEGDSVHVLFTQGSELHHGSIPKQFLKDFHSHNTHEYRIRKSRRPDVLEGAIKTLEYSEFESSELGLVKALSTLVQDGVIILKNAPQRRQLVTECMSKCGPIMPTIYGPDWDVRVEPNPINVAYSGEFLDYHMDLVYYESPPGLQALHVFTFDDSTVGGDSILVDAFHVAERLREQRPELFDTLTRVPATFQKIHFSRDQPVYMRARKPHIRLSGTGEVTEVSWAPAFEGPLLCAEPADLIDDYYEAYRHFGEMLQTEPTAKKFKLTEGDVLIFNNRRLLHGRTAIVSGSGARHLRGTYVNIDEFLKTYNVLAVKHGLPLSPKRVGNGDES